MEKAGDRNCNEPNTISPGYWHANCCYFLSGR